MKQLAPSGLPTQTIIALIALMAGSAAAVAGDYRDHYGNDAYYGNIYENHGAHDRSNDTSSIAESGTSGDGQRQHHKHPITGNECSSDALSSSNCGASP